MNVFCLHVCLCTTSCSTCGSQLTGWIFWHWSYKWLWALMWVLRLKPRSSVRVARGLTHLFSNPLPSFLKSRVARILGWPWAHYVFEDDLEFLIFLSQVLPLQAYVTMPSLFSSGAWTWGSSYARWALCQPSYIPAPFECSCFIISEYLKASHCVNGGFWINHFWTVIIFGPGILFQSMEWVIIYLQFLK